MQTILQLLLKSEYTSLLDVGCTFISRVVNYTQFTSIGGLHSSYSLLSSSIQEWSPTPSDNTLRREALVVLKLYHGTCAFASSTVRQYEVVTMFDGEEFRDRLDVFPKAVFGARPKLVIMKDLKSTDFKKWYISTSEQYGYEVELMRDFIIFRIISAFVMIPDLDALTLNEKLKEEPQLVKTIKYPVYEVMYRKEDMALEVRKAIAVQNWSLDELWAILRVRQICKTKAAFLECLRTSRDFRVAKNSVTLLYKEQQPTSPILVIFDLNGTLISRLTKSEDKALAKRNPFCPSKCDFGVKGAQVYVRPHWYAFLASVMRLPHIKVAVWTSAQQSNADKISRALFGMYFGRLEFVLDRSHCEDAPVAVKSKLTAKNLELVFKSKPLSSNGKWTEKNTIMVDDSINKLRYQKNNLLLVPTYDVTDDSIDCGQDTTMLQLKNWLELSPSRMTSGNVQRMITDYPLGHEPHL